LIACLFQLAGQQPGDRNVIGITVGGGAQDLDGLLALPPGLQGLALAIP
jgi:hypothetical protein